MIFTVGNLITLGIVACVLVLYRLADKNNRPLEKVKKYAEKCKEDIAAYAEEKSMAVKNFGIDLDVERKAAAQLMKNIQHYTEEELVKNSEAIAQIKEHIHAFESSLDELFGMTDRVQENLNRIRDESAFVENTNKRVSEAKEKLEYFEKTLETAAKNLQETEGRLEQKNAEAMEQAVRDVIDSAKSKLSDFEAAANVIEHKIEGHREIVVKAEREREDNLARDIEQVKKVLKDVFENAGKRAEKMEETVFIKLREQAQERVNQIKAFFDDKLKVTQDTLKNEQGVINDKLKNIHEKCNAEILDMSTKQKNYHQEWVRGAGELDSMAKKQKEDIVSSLARQQEEITTALTKERDTINSALLQQQNDWKLNFLELKKSAEKQRKDLDTNLLTSKTELNQAISDLRMKSQTALKQQHDELDAAVKLHHKDITTAVSELKEKSGTAIKIQQQETNDCLSKLNASLSELHSQSKILQKQQQDELGAILGELREKSGFAVKQQQNEVNSLLSEVKEKTETTIKLQQDELASVLKELKEKSYSTIKFQQDEINSVLGTAKQKSEAAVQIQQDEINAAISAIKQELYTAVKSQHDEIGSAIKGIKEKSNEAVTQQYEELSSVLRELKEKTDSAVKLQQNELSLTLKELKEKSDNAVLNQQNDLNTALEKQMESWKSLTMNTERDIIAANEKRLDDYSKVNAEAVRQLNSLADDAGRLENELRISMQEALSRVKKDFSVYEKESAVSMETAAAAFDAQAQSLRKELEQMDKELNEIRQQAYDNVSEKLTSFENDFTMELGKRSSEIGRHIADWQTSLEERLTSSSDKIEGGWKIAEEQFISDQRKNITSLGERLTSDLEVLKHDTSIFEQGIREEMNSVDQTRASFIEQVKYNIKEMRSSAENEVKIQVGQYQLSMQEVLRQKQRELEKDLEDISERCQSTHDTLDDALLNSRQAFDEWQGQYNIRIRETETSFEDLRRHSREITAENEERFSQFRLNLDDIRKELGIQKKVFDQTSIIKRDLEKSIEEINGDLNRLEQRKNEITELETRLTAVKRLEDEVNNKMTRIFNEKTRVEQLENNVNSLIKTSQSVKEKLEQVSTSDDVLQAVQLQIRKLNDSIKETEEKFLRIERKKEVLEQTNDDIDRNFKSLQKTENAIKNAEDIISSLSGQFDNLRSSIEILAAQSEKALYAEEKITVLDETLAKIEKRIADMNVAREWLARTETELKALDKDARTYLKLTKSFFERESARTPAASTGAPTPQDRDDILKLKTQGWSNKEIADAMNKSIGEVELTLEVASRS
jgi:hypothetical protein